MNGRGFLSVLLLASIGIGPLASTGALAQRFDMGGFAGGLLGGAIAGAMISNAQRQPAVVYRSRPVYGRPAYRGAARRVASRRVAPPHKAATAAAVVDTSADPFAAKASSAALPVAARP